ncbi:NUDIX hydrolase [Streptomyces bauhiniae]|uniref:NUDIX hydrolase n=1 Tax=Streptomyces bauhiniae TaxID=2340725 RepID=A0A4Z1D916_9ACTN|nr:NUDIX hydrolase [Streptomyces bauhiniae]TGN79217.1 NUDIX hydrolase [Streptomyces bauhiniae]
MTSEREAGGRVLAVAVYDGRLLLVTQGDGGPWTLPSGTAEPAETPGATAERVVYELTGYLVDGTEPLGPADGESPDAVPAVVCQLLTDSPSGGASLPEEQIRWVAFEEAERDALPPAVRHYLQGHSPV